ncbi:MAG: hypothetical protein RL094_698 [Candidatus Parcubacteria bacterium]|jgi:NRAMP (natural resistance-associated macrophage protein)-like metal ion transporter
MKHLIEKVVSIPAKNVGRTIHFSKYLSRLIMDRKSIKAAEDYWKKLGPGLTTGAADDDPSGIATYSQAGAQYGYGYTWMAIATYPLMAVVQEMCARIGLVSGEGLAANIRNLYSKKFLYVVTLLLFIANTFNIGANLGAMAKATQLVFPSVSFPLLVIGFTVLSLLLQIFTSYKTYASYLKWLALILFAYIITAFTIDLNWTAIFTQTFLPTIQFNKETILIIAAILGTTISPYLFFWQTSQEVEEKILKKSERITFTGEVEDVEPITKGEIKTMRIDVWTGMFISNLVMFFIMVVCGATLFEHGITNIGTAADAANALRPLAGDGAYLLFAMGIIGTGLLAVPILAGSTSYAISESFNWRYGLYRKFREASAFYLVIIASMVVGLIMNFTSIDPIKALIYSAVLNCLVAPLVLVFIVLVSSNKKVMKQHVNKPLTTFIGWAVTLLMFVVAGAVLFV